MNSGLIFGEYMVHYTTLYAICCSMATAFVANKYTVNVDRIA